MNQLDLFAPEAPVAAPASSPHARQALLDGAIAAGAEQEVLALALARRDEWLIAEEFEPAMGIASFAVELVLGTLTRAQKLRTRVVYMGSAIAGMAIGPNNYRTFQIEWRAA